MTVIARSLNNNAPVVVSDMLITAKIAPKVFTPPLFETDISHLLTGAIGQPTRLAQKIYLVADRVCIAFSGYVFEMARFLEDFTLFCKTAPVLDGPSLTAFLKEYDYSEFQSSSFFIMFIEGHDGQVVRVREFTMRDFVSGHGEHFDTYIATGSGAHDFLAILNQKMEYLSSFERGELRDAIVKFGSLIAQLLVLEYNTQADLLKAWGGAFEYAFYNGRRFQKSDNVAYIVNHGEIQETGSMLMPFPMVVLYHKYVNEILVVTSVFYGNHQLDSDDTYYYLRSDQAKAKATPVPPIQQGIFIPPELNEPTSFETHWIGMGYLVNTFDHISLRPAYFTASPDLRVSFSAENGTVEIRMKKDMMDMTVKGLQRGLALMTAPATEQAENKASPIA